MTVLNGFVPSAGFKEELHEPMASEQIIHSNGHQEPCRPQMPLKPVEDYRYFVALVAVEDGSIQLRCSQDMKPYKRMVLDQDAVHRFHEVMNDYIQQPGPAKRHRPTNHSPAAFIPRDLQFPPCTRKSAKRRHAGIVQGTIQPFFVRSEQKVDVKQPTQPGRQLQIRLDDRKAQEKWFSDAFKAVQQVGCRTIAKVWIKKIHPKKQSTHPYNGGFPRDQQADPDRTRPPYWPSNVIHKEPDHIDRNARTALLVHLITNTPQSQIRSPQDSDTLISARDLLLALEEKRNDFKSDRWDIISEIIDAREQIEMYESGGFDGDTSFHVPDFSERSARGDTDGEGEENDFPAPEPASTAGMVEHGQEDSGGTTPMASAVPSLSQPAHDSISQIGQFQQDLASYDSERNVVARSSAPSSTNTFPSASNSFSNDSPEQDCSAMLGNTHPFPAESKRDRSDHRLQQLRMPHQVHDFQKSRTCQHQDLLAQQWMPIESPTTYVPPGYALEDMHPQTQISSQHYRTSDASLMHGNLQEIAMNSGLPVLSCMQFEEYQPRSRPLPARALSTPHPMMLDHGMLGAHGLDAMQPTFYIG